MKLRQLQILELLKEKRSLSCSKLSEDFSVSEMTIHRDLKELELLGYVNKIRGGVLINQNLFSEHSFGIKKKENIEKKEAIAREAVKLIQPNDIVILDAGSTTLAIAQEMARSNLSNVKIATNSLAVVNALLHTNYQIVLFGGLIRKEIPDLIGPLTEENIKKFHANRLFVGCTGIEIGSGFYNTDLHISVIEQIMISITDEVIVVADSTKFGRKSFTKFADFSVASTIITDCGLLEEYKQQIRKHDVTLIIADI